MMGTVSDYAENKLVDHGLGTAYTAPATVYLALSTADPTDTGSALAEPSGGAYARQAIAFGAAASRRVTQSGAVTFSQASGAWGTITHWSILDASTAGNVLASGAFATSKTVVSGNTPSVGDAEIYVEVTAGGASNYLANKFLDLMFRNQAFAAPTTRVALITATVADTDTGSTIVEPSGGAYARVTVNLAGGASPAWTAASGGSASNANAITFPDATASWGTIVATAVVDAVTVGAGNLLMYDNGTTDQPVGTGDTASIPTGGITVTAS